MNQQRQDRIKQMLDSLPPEWDKRPILLAEEVCNFLETVKDEGTQIDTGTDGQSGDLWLFVQGVEYWINIRKSNNQLVKEGKLPPPQPLSE